MQDVVLVQVVQPRHDVAEQVPDLRLRQEPSQGRVRRSMSHVGADLTTNPSEGHLDQNTTKSTHIRWIEVVVQRAAGRKLHQDE